MNKIEIQLDFINTYIGAYGVECKYGTPAMIGRARNELMHIIKLALESKALPQVAQPVAPAFYVADSDVEHLKDKMITGRGCFISKYPKDGFSPYFAASQSVADGWKLVPTIPTDRMTHFGQAMRYDRVNSIGAIYMAMLEQAPPFAASQSVAKD